jgi:hypothetical protein
MAEELKLSGKTVDCPVCNKNAALEEDTAGITSWLCVNCGYTTNSMFIENNSEFAGTPAVILKLKHWDALRNIYWIPTVINMPSRGLIFPEKYGKQIFWTCVLMVDIPEKEQKNYPIADREGKFFTRKLDTDNAKKFTKFYEALKQLGAIIEMDEFEETIIEEKINAN